MQERISSNVLGVKLNVDEKHFIETEKLLLAWGIECREKATMLGLPETSSISNMIDHVRTESRLRKGVSKKRTSVNATKDEEEPEQEPALTARGRQTRSFVQPKVQIRARIAQVDHAIAGLPRWAKKCINRSYRFRQPDRIAAVELKMRHGEYSQRRRAAVELVANRLSDRYIQAR